MSLEVSPQLAHDTQGTIEAAKRLHGRVDRNNLMIKIPATKEGLPAIRAVLGSGINVNVTLIFSLDRYDEVITAWTQGLQDAYDAGLDLGGIASVASFFVSRVDVAVDELLPEGDPRRGTTANAQVAAAYERYRARMRGDDVTSLLAKGAQVQRPLWASTSTKNPTYDDLLYVDTIVADETVNTMPDATLADTLDHANFAASVASERRHDGENGRGASAPRARRIAREGGRATRSRRRRRLCEVLRRVACDPGLQDAPGQVGTALFSRRGRATSTSGS